MPCRDRTFDESRFIPQDAAVTILTKINPASGTYGGGEIFSAQYELLPADIYKSRQLFKGTGACRNRAFRVRVRTLNQRHKRAL